MKKVIKLISILSLVTLLLVACSSSEERKAQKVAKKFGTEVNTVNLKRIHDYNDMINDGNIEPTAEDMYSNDKILRSLMTKDGYNNLVKDRLNIIFTEICSSGNCTIQVTDLTLSKNAYDIKKNKAGYNFVAKLKFVENKDKTENKDVWEGYIGLTKENGQWKVTTYKVNVVPKLKNRY